MFTITAGKLIDKLRMVPSNTPVFIIGNNGENGLINNVSIESDNETNFNKFEVRIDYEI